ncbi:MAG: 2-oxoacid:acceptor oxidoreductase family protein [Acidimicrobiales bacterium]|jgi:pyruvate ferredoxin oxidoreductase gamma subunit
MFQVRFHGRGGQGVVTAAEMLSVAAFLDGKYAQAFPSFGSERTGAPVVSYCRISDREIRTRAPVEEPDAVIIQDATLLHQVDLFAGVTPDGFVLVNTSHSFDELGIGDFVGQFPLGHLLTVPATEIAMRHFGRPLPNAVLLGGFAVMTGEVSMDSVIAAIGERFSGSIAEGNAAAAREAAGFVEEERLARASSD